MTVIAAPPIRAQRGTGLRCRSWRAEALLRMLENTLECGERPADLVVYAAIGKAARDHASYERIVSALTAIREHETLVIQSGKPIGVFPTHPSTPLVVIANSNLVGRFATPEQFYALEQRGRLMWGGLTAGDWQYIGLQGVVQGTFETFSAVAREHFGGDLRGRLCVSAGLGGMGQAQPIAVARMLGAVLVIAEVDAERARLRVESGVCDRLAGSVDEALAWADEARARGEGRSVALVSNAADLLAELVARGVVPDVVTDLTSAHDLRYGYVPAGLDPAGAGLLRERDPAALEARAGETIARHVDAMLTLRDRGAVVFDYGNNIRPQALAAGVEQAMTLPVFTERYLRPLFCQGIGPFRWVVLTGEEDDLAHVEELALELFPDDARLQQWIALARRHVPAQGLPARIAWLGHGARARLATAVNEAVAAGRIGPVAFTRDHLDAAAMCHPFIMTEGLLDGTDAVADWPLLDALLLTGAGADLVAIHSGGGGYAGTMTSCGVTITADGSPDAAERLARVQDADTGLGVLRYADAGYAAAEQLARAQGLGLP